MLGLIEDTVVLTDDVVELIEDTDELKLLRLELSEL
jgi:hypothetical protein